MTTVIDPAGTPVPVYNRSGTTIVEITATAATPTPVYPIAAASGHTVALVDVPNPGGFGPPDIELPGGADTGDVVEAYVTGASVNFVAASGDTLVAANPSVDANKGAWFRKTSATVWMLIHGG